jgi:hypothetical protein
VQWPQRFAAIGIDIAHCGQSLAVGTAGAAAGFLIHRFTKRTTMNTQNATIRKLTTAFKNRP